MPELCKIKQQNFSTAEPLLSEPLLSEFSIIWPQTYSLNSIQNLLLFFAFSLSDLSIIRPNCFSLPPQKGQIVKASTVLNYEVNFT